MPSQWKFPAKKPPLEAKRHSRHERGPRPTPAPPRLLTGHPEREIRRYRQDPEVGSEVALPTLSGPRSDLTARFHWTGRGQRFDFSATPMGQPVVENDLRSRRKFVSGAQTIVRSMMIAFGPQGLLPNPSRDREGPEGANRTGAPRGP